MPARINREDLEHLLRLVETGLHDDIAAHGEVVAAGGPSATHAIFAPRHALWNANHSFWVERLKSETGGAWTDDQYVTAATIINTAEYQHVLFSDIASALTHGLSEGWDRHAAVGEESSGRLSSEGRRIVPSHFDETVDLVDASTGQLRQINLAAVLEDVQGPHRSDDHTAGGGDAKHKTAPDEFRGALGNVFSPRVLDLGELTGSRAHDGGRVPFNQVRGELFAQFGLSTLLPYAGWDDFRERNNLSDGLIAELKAAYPEGFAALDLWVGGLAESPTVGDLGPTIAAAVNDEIAQLRNENPLSCLDLLAGTHILSEIGAQSLSDIVVRNAGAADLADDLLGSADRADTEIEHGSGKAIFGTDGDDVLVGGAGDDFLDGRRGADVMAGGSGNDTYVVDDVGDRVIENLDEGDDDTILTSLHSFALEDAPWAGGEPVSSDVSSRIALGPIGIADGASAGAAAIRADAVVETDIALASGEATSEASSDIVISGRAANVENLSYIGDGSFTGSGNSSDNVISGGGRDDTLWGAGGDDELYGNSGDDVLFGGYGDDWLDGGDGDDVLFVSSGTRDNAQSADEVLFATYGHDTIVLRPGFGNDVVIGFDANENDSDGRDRLDVTAYESLTADSIGTEILITESGPHTIITINGDSITLLDVNSNAIGKDDFIFS